MAKEWHPIDPGDKRMAEEGQIAEFKVGKKGYCLLRHEGRWFAFDAKCSHANGPLAAGWVEEGCIVCPWHRYAFDLDSGQAERGGYFIETYPVKEKENKLWIGLKKKKRGWFW